MRYYFAVCVKVDFSNDEVDTIARNSLLKQKILDRVPADDIATEYLDIYALTLAHLVDNQLDCHCCETQQAADDYEKLLSIQLEKLETQLQTDLIFQR